MFPGNTHEIKTLLPILEELRKDLTIKSVDFAADRGMFSEGNLKKLAEMNTTYVVAARLKKMGEEMDKKILAVHEQGSADCHLVKDIAWKGRRLIVCYNPATAAKDRQVRQRLLERQESFYPSLPPFF